MSLKYFILVAVIVAVCDAAPKRRRKYGHNYDNYDEVHLRSQNGTENYKLSINDVVLVLSPPAGLIQAASLIDPSILFGEYPDVEEIFNQQNQEKPEDLLVVRPSEKPEAAVITSSTAGSGNSTSTSTTTGAPVESSTNASKIEENEQALPASSRHTPPRRRYRLPDFMRPFLGRLRPQPVSE